MRSVFEASILACVHTLPGPRGSKPKYTGRRNSVLLIVETFESCDTIWMVPAEALAALSSLAADEPELDALTLGRRIRELRTARRMTLDTLAAAIDRAPSQVSMMENGKREPRLSMLRTIALALDTTVDELMRTDAPSERAALEISVERAQRGPVFQALGLPRIRVSKGQSNETLHTILSLHNEIDRLNRERAATPEEARRAGIAAARCRHGHPPGLLAALCERSAALHPVGHRQAQWAHLPADQPLVLAGSPLPDRAGLRQRAVRA
jgi:transcriptional regulator with XRE-family HTH domain